MTNMHHVYLGLGSNLGDRISYLSNAVREISKHFHVLSISSIYETEPVGYKSQPEFLNLVMEIETALNPSELLSQLKLIERSGGRVHQEHLRPREIDIDILLFDELLFKDDNITIPHSELHKRRFVLEPLNEIASNVVHPTLNSTVATLLEHCPDKSRVVRRQDIQLPEHKQLSL